MSYDIFVLLFLLLNNVMIFFAYAFLHVCPIIPKDKSLEAESWVRGHALWKCLWYSVPNCPIEMLGLFTHSLSSVWLVICMFQDEFLIFLRHCFVTLVNLSAGFWMKALASWMYLKCCWWIFGALCSHNLFCSIFCTALINQFYY